MSKLDYKRFAIFAYIGAAIWVAVFLSIGYVVGENWRSVLPVMHRYTIWVLAMAVVLGAILYWLRMRRGKRDNTLRHPAQFP
jgi:undecaprenyl-diphosphatase